MRLASPKGAGSALVAHSRRLWWAQGHHTQVEWVTKATTVFTQPVLPSTSITGRCDGAGLSWSQRSVLPVTRTTQDGAMMVVGRCNPNNEPKSTTKYTHTRSNKACLVSKSHAPHLCVPIYFIYYITLYVIGLVAVTPEYT
jgi:hypothetical protein